MKTIHLAVAGVVVACLPPAATAQQMLASDRVSVQMLAGDGGHEIPASTEKLVVAIDGEHASSDLIETYPNDSSVQIEGRYALRPGQGSHVDGFAYWNGEEKIVGEVFERQTAERVYNQVTQRRRDPALLEQDGEGLFSFRVFPIAPHEQKRVEVKWSKWLDRHGETVTYRAPVTSRGAEVVVTLEGPVKNVASSTHALSIEQIPGGVRLRATRPLASFAGELDLTYEIAEPAWTPDVYVQPAAGHDEGWFAIGLAAPHLPASAAIAKDVTIVIDRSGSMEEDQKMFYAKRAASALVGLLGVDDRVNVIAFSDEVDPLFHEPHAADAQTRRDVNAFIDRLAPGGGTDLALALKTAVGAQATDKSERPHVVVFLTDGMSEAASAIAVKTGNVQLFTLGVGTDVNKPLLNKLAAEKRGRFVYIEDAREIEPEVTRLGAAIAHPLLHDVSVSIDGIEATRMYPRTLPDVFAEDELRVSGRFRGAGPAKVTIRGTLEGKPVAFTRAIDFSHAHGWVAPVWAQARIDHLLEQLELDDSGKSELRDEVIDLALAYNFVTPYTAFLAVPERELNPAAAQTIADARARKRQIAQQEAQPAPTTTVAANSPPSGNGQVIDMFGADSAEADAPSPRAHKRVAAADTDDDVSPTSEPRVHGHGCAGCATGGGGGASWLALVGVVALVLTRRRAGRSR
jgi:Ca-activated chloride channel family protein